MVRPVAGVAPPDTAARRSFWTGYQPGMRGGRAPIGTPEFFAQVEAERYALEPAILELVDFGRWAGRDVLEGGCGIGTDALRFVRAGARYTGVDFSPTALELARRRPGLESVKLVAGSVTELPFDDASFDLVYANGVIHHLPETRRAIAEFHRVLRPGGTAIVMVYHRQSFNFFVSIMLVRRLLAALLLLPGADRLAARITGEDVEVLRGHRALLSERGVCYLRDPALFLSHNTDGPGNPLSKVYSRAGMGRAFAEFSAVRTDVRFFNLRAYPRGEQLERLPAVRALGRHFGWHLWITATK
jgi:SAM-dependent methyltransferase